MRRRYMYKLQRIRDSYTWPKGSVIWALQPCTGWRVVGKIQAD